jgi:hypothetical protein
MRTGFSNTHNPEAVGSNPSPATKKNPRISTIRGFYIFWIRQIVRRNTATVLQRKIFDCVQLRRYVKLYVSILHLKTGVRESVNMSKNKKLRDLSAFVKEESDRFENEEKALESLRKEEKKNRIVNIKFNKFLKKCETNA